MLARRYEIAAFHLGLISAAENPLSFWRTWHHWYFSVKKQVPSEKLSHTFSRTHVLMMTSVLTLGLGSDNLN